MQEIAAIAIARTSADCICKTSLGVAITSYQLLGLAYFSSTILNSYNIISHVGGRR
jgi:hypothetical protein